MFLSKLHQNLPTTPIDQKSCQLSYIVIPSVRNFKQILMMSPFEFDKHQTSKQNKALTTYNTSDWTTYVEFKF